MLLWLGGCSEPEQEITQYIAEIKKRPALPVEPLPEFTVPPSAIYQAHQLRDPFLPDKQPKVNRLQPDRDRPMEPLEAYPLDSLKMVGTLEQKDGKWALIATPDGTVQRVGLDQHLGQNHGRVVAIYGDSIELMEWIQEQGEWIERPVRLVLGEKTNEAPG